MNSLSAVTYKGSIPQAIVESKNQKKLFVVYISGVDADSDELEKSTWTDSKVVESLSKCCILLHLPEGSTDAINFAAIYPFKAVPSIVAIGYNGVQLWQSEGFVNAEVLASSLEKAWLSLHIQETTATVLTAALASKEPELSTAESSDVVSFEKGSSSGTVPSTNKHLQSSDAVVPAASEKTQEHIVEDKDTRYAGMGSPRHANGDESRSINVEESRAPAEETRGLPSHIHVNQDDSFGDGMSSNTEDGHLSSDKIINHHSADGGDLQLAATKTNAVQDEVKTDPVDDDKRVNAPSDVYLNIRLPSGISLQDKFSVTSTLRMVKDYVDKDQASGLGSYDLAIPYPRKVFSDEDLSKSLSELGLFNRQALIVVPRQRSTGYVRGGSSSDQTAATYHDSSSASGGGYFSYLRSMLSYINPLSYLGGSTSSTSSGQPQSGMWEYSPNPALQNNLARIERPYSSNMANQGSSATSTNNNRSQTTNRSGSNIHTLKHDEDDGKFGDRNSFWNGNSTQYGGNNNDDK